MLALLDCSAEGRGSAVRQSSTIIPVDAASTSSLATCFASELPVRLSLFGCGDFPRNWIRRRPVELPLSWAALGGQTGVIAPPKLDLPLMEASVSASSPTSSSFSPQLDWLSIEFSSAWTAGTGSAAVLCTVVAEPGIIVTAVRPRRRPIASPMARRRRRKRRAPATHGLLAAS